MSTILRRGSSGAEVRALQHALNARPYLHVVEDGVFGPKTEQAVRTFQNRVHLQADGVVGAHTHALLWTRVVIANTRIQVPVASSAPHAANRAVASSPVSQTSGSGSQGRSSAPPTPSAPASNGAGVVHQVSLGGQVTLAPWLVRPTPPPGTPSGNIWSGVVSYAFVYRTAADGPHIEVALNPQFLLNSRVQTTDPRWALQVNGQVMFADLVAPGAWHLISPYIQGGVGMNFDPGPTFGGGFAIGNQVSLDLIKDRLQLTLQAGVGAQWSNIGTRDAQFSVLGQGALGATVQF